MARDRAWGQRWDPRAAPRQMSPDLAGLYLPHLKHGKNYVCQGGKKDEVSIR